MKLEWFFWLALVTLLRWGALDQPPVWDETMTLFPSAQELLESGFDFTKIDRTQGLWQVGAGLHVNSLYTVLTAAVLGVAPTVETAYCMLHVIQFAMMATCLMTLRRLLSLRESGIVPWIFALAALICPIVFVQAGALYYEIPLMLCATQGLWNMSREQWTRAAVWMGAAALIKPTGIVLLASWMICLVADPRVRPDRRAALTTAVAGALWVLATWGGHMSGPRLDVVPEDLTTHLVDHVLDYMMLVPDLTLVFLVTVALVAARRVSWGPAHVFSGLAVVAHFGMFVGTYVIGHPAYCLPRYLVILVPGCLLVLHRVSSGRTRSWAVALTLVVWFGANLDGNVLPELPRSDWSMSERSLESNDHLSALNEALNALPDVASGASVICGIPEAYLFKFWANGRQDLLEGLNWKLVVDDRLERLKLDDLPPSFVVFRHFDYLGGRELDDLVREARESGRMLTVREFNRGEGRIRLIRVDP